MPSISFSIKGCWRNPALSPKMASTERGRYTFLCDHTGEVVPFYLHQGTWRHYTRHPLWNESRIFVVWYQRHYGHILPEHPLTPWLPLLRKLIHLGYQHQELAIDFSHRPYRVYTLED